MGFTSLPQVGDAADAVCALEAEHCLLFLLLKSPDLLYPGQERTLRVPGQVALLAGCCVLAKKGWVIVIASSV